MEETIESEAVETYRRKLAVANDALMKERQRTYELTVKIAELESKCKRLSKTLRRLEDSNGWF